MNHKHYVGIVSAFRPVQVEHGAMQVKAATRNLRVFPITARGSVDARPKRLPKRKPIFWVSALSLLVYSRILGVFFDLFLFKMENNSFTTYFEVCFFSTKCLPKMWLLYTLRHHRPRDHLGNACRRPSGTHSAETVPDSQETQALTFEQTPVGHVSFTSWRRCNHTVFGSTTAFGFGVCGGREVSVASNANSQHFDSFGTCDSTWLCSQVVTGRSEFHKTKWSTCSGHRHGW